MMDGIGEAVLFILFYPVVKLCSGFLVSIKLDLKLTKKEKWSTLPGHVGKRLLAAEKSVLGLVTCTYPKI